MDEPIVLDMTDARIGAHYVSGAVIKYLYDRFGSRIYTKKVSELYNCKTLIVVRNLEKSTFGRPFEYWDNDYVWKRLLQTYLGKPEMEYKSREMHRYGGMKDEKEF